MRVPRSKNDHPGQVARARGVRSHSEDAADRPAEHLERLQLGDTRHEVQVRLLARSDLTEGQHTHRLAASHAHSRYLPWVAPREVPLPSVAPVVDQFTRPPNPNPTWRAQQLNNLVYLRPGGAWGFAEAMNRRVSAFSRTFQNALREICEQVPRLWPEVDQAEAKLSRPSRMLLKAMREAASQSPIPYLGAHDLSSLLDGEGGLADAGLSRLFARADFGGAMTIASLEAAHGAEGGKFLATCLNEVIPRLRGLQSVILHAAPPMEPSSPDTPLTREEARLLLTRAPHVLDAAVASSSIPASMPDIDAAGALIPDAHFRGARVVAVQHVLGTNVTMFRKMFEKGLAPTDCEIVGVPYSTNYVVEHAFRQLGVRIDTPEVIDPNDVGPKVVASVEAALRRAIDRSAADGRKILVLDDGGKAARAIHERLSGELHRFKLVEQTTRGITEHVALGGLRVPGVVVASAPLKRHEAPKIGQEVVAAAELLTERCGLDAIRGKAVCVVGFGVIGTGVARALRDRGARVTVLETDPKAGARARDDDFFVTDDKATALSGKALVLGCTGLRSITRKDVAYLQDQCALGSASSADVEIDLTTNRDPAVETLPLLAGGPGDARFVTRVWRLGNKDIVVLKNGFPLNFDGRVETGTNESIQLTRALMLLGAAQAWSKEDAGGVPLALDDQRKLALRIGLELPEELRLVT